MSSSETSPWSATFMEASLRSDDYSVIQVEVSLSWRDIALHRYQSLES